MNTIDNIIKSVTGPIARLDKLAKVNREKIIRNDKTIGELRKQNERLNADARRAVAVAQNLQNLVSK